MDFLPPSTVSIAKELQAIRKAIQAPKKELEDKRKKKKQERKRGKSEESAAEKRIRNSSPTDGNEKENWRTSWDNKLTRKRPLEPNHTENNAVNRDPRLRVKSNEQLGFGPTKVKPTLAVDTDSDEECVYLRDDQRRFNVVKHKLFQVDELPVPQPATEKLTEAEKRQLAMSRAEKVLKLFEQKRTGAQEDEFFMVNTIRKVPESDSRMRQKAVKNASSLCRNQNVDYEFNSVPGTQIDLVKWGLETVPNSTRDLLQLMPLDVDHLKQAGLKTQPSQPILKLKQEQLFNAPSELEDSDSLLINAGTQTDVKPHMESVGTQVKLTGQPIGPFWHDIHFDPTVLTRTQLYYIFSLKQLMRTQPSHAEAARIYKVLQTALDIQREYHPRN
ncbi:protein panoramix-like [Drosophila obscura]|uniref:protein panoramix-like n=1 Tax=Drosophila obscura TaxID=7282 RepID=UPI001BB0F27F|nr:protein panoramix-like [Drosophila obscura]